MANEFILTRRGAVIGRVLFTWVSLADWTTKDVRLEGFTDQALERDLVRLLDRNEPRLTIAGGHTGDLRSFYEGLQAALYWLQQNGGSFDYEAPPDVPDREEDPLADY